MTGPTDNTTTPILFWLCGAVLLLALLAGGGTHKGFYGDVAVQLLSIPLLATALWPAFGDAGDHKRKARLALAACSVCAIVLLIQVLPLPFDVWAGRKALLPDGDETRFGLYRPGWSTLSITPQATWAAAVSLLVPLSVFASVMQLGLRQRLNLCWLLLGVGAASLALGFLQVAQGPDSALRFYEESNPEAVGFFANRNHFAAFLNVTLVLSALWLTQAMEASLEKRAFNPSSLLWIAAAAAFIVAIVAGHALVRSRAGALLAIATLVAIVLMVFAQSRSHRIGEHPRHTTIMGRASVALALFAAIFALQFGLGHILERFESDPADDLRIPLNVTTFETALRALPFGTGLGSFVPVYATVEKSKDVISAFANRAHDDPVELFLETGLMGVGLGLLFLVWFGRRVVAIWRRQQSENVSPQLLLERASTLIVVLLLVHSLVDYPLRTSALGAVFALFCAILATPIAIGPMERPKPRRRRSKRPKAEAVPAVTWSDDMDWPESWQKKGDNAPA